MCAPFGLNTFGRIFSELNIGVNFFQILPNSESVKLQNDSPYTQCTCMRAHTHHTSEGNFYSSETFDICLSPK